MNNLKQFIEKIIEDAGLANMPEEFKKEYGEKMLLEAEKRIGITALKYLNEDQIKELVTLSEKNPDNPEKIDEFLKKNIKNYEEVISNALRDFAQDVINSAKKIS